MYPVPNDVWGATLGATRCAEAAPEQPEPGSKAGRRAARAAKDVASRPTIGAVRYGGSKT